MTARLRIRRVYEKPSRSDGWRVLVDRLWPRGLKKDAARIDAWLKDVAPSDALRRWFGHNTTRWPEFQRRYFAELDARPGAWKEILDRLREGTVTLLYAARDREHNNAVALRAYLERRARRR